MSEQVKDFDDEIDLLGLLSTFWRGKLWILLGAVLATLIGIYYAVSVATPLYTSSATLAIEESRPSIVDIESVVSGVSSDSEALNTQLEVLKSRDLLERLAAQLDLKNDPEFNPSLRPVSLLSVEGILNSVKRLTGGAQDAQPRSEQAVINDLVENLRSAIGVAVRRKTYVITISVTTADPDKSMVIANTLADLYLDDQIRVKFETLEDAVTWLSARVIELEEELQDRDDTLKEQTADADYINVEGLQLLNQQVRNLRERLIGERSDADRAQAHLMLLNISAQEGDLAGILDATQDPTLRRLSEQQDRNTLLDDGSAFQLRLAALLDRNRTDVERAQTQVLALEEIIASMETRVDEQATKLAELQQLQREMDTVSVLYETFLTRLKETTIQQGIQQPDARILSTAITGEKVSPRIVSLTALSMVLGIAAGALLVLIREFRANGFRNADELQSFSGTQVIGQVPIFPFKKRDDLLRYLHDKPTSPAVEAIRNLRTSVLLSNVDQPPQLIMSTSTIPGEGKTTQAISLSQNLAGLGKRVLLIEGDIRRRTLDEYFDVKAGQHGLLSVVSGEVPLADAVIHSDLLKADVLMGQKSHINAADLFASDKFADFIQTIRAAYDYIIIDTPPVLVVPDARVIGQHCDAIIYTVKWDSTTKPQLQAALRELAAVNLNITGLVLSQVDPKGMKRYGYGEAHGAYSSYGGGYYDA